MSKTRNQRKQKIIDGIKCIVGGTVMFIVFFALCLLLCSMGCKTFAEHPAEQPVDGHTYLEMVQGWVAE